MVLHGNYRSTASWRVRIALNLKGIAYAQVAHHRRHGEQKRPEFLRINPQGLVPAVEMPDADVITQSHAICEWIEGIAPQPSILPDDPLTRAAFVPSPRRSPAISIPFRT